MRARVHAATCVSHQPFRTCCAAMPSRYHSERCASARPRSAAHAPRPASPLRLAIVASAIWAFSGQPRHASPLPRHAPVIRPRWRQFGPRRAASWDDGMPGAMPRKASARSALCAGPTPSAGHRRPIAFRTGRARAARLRGAADQAGATRQKQTGRNRPRDIVRRRRYQAVRRRLGNLPRQAPPRARRHQLDLAEGHPIHR